MNRKKIERKLLFSVIIFSMLFLNSNFTIPFSKSVDINYSTYLYNQDINLDNDNAHLLQESAEGSNSYRNTFESNFLFPSKINTDMLTSTSTTEYSHYQFNQYYIDNLDNNYAYSNYNNTEIEHQNVNDYDVNIGSSIDNGLGNTINNNDYNSTYTFDNYNETYSNYGNYFMSNTNDFNNEIIGTKNDNIQWIDSTNNVNENNYFEIIDNINGHNNVLKINDATTDSFNCRHDFESSINDIIFEFWMSTSDISASGWQCYIEPRSNSEGSMIALYISNNHFYAYNGSGVIIKNAFINNNEFFHVKVITDDLNDMMDVYINGILECENIMYWNKISSGIDYIRIRPETTAIVNTYIDGFGVHNQYGYSINDNTNAFGLQAELENDFTTVDYRYDTSICIKNDSNYHNNYIEMIDNSETELSRIIYTDDNEMIIGSIEFQVKVNCTNKLSRLFLRGNGGLSSISLFFYSDGYISVYNYSNLVDLLSYNSNQWYSFKIDFDFDLDIFNLSIDSVMYANNFKMKNNQEADYFNTLYITTWNDQINNKLCLDNLDFSWNTEYYPFRSMFPNGNLYQASSDNGFDILKPDSDISYNFHIPDTTEPPYFNRLNDYPELYDYDYISVDNVDVMSELRLSLSNVSITTKDYNKLSCFLYYYAYYGTDSELSIYINDVLTYQDDFDIIAIGGNSTIYNNPSYWNLAVLDFESLSLNYSEINNMEIILKMPSLLSSFYDFRIESFYIQAFYNGNSLGVNYEKEIEYSKEKPYAIKINYAIGSNTTQEIQTYVYNFDIEEYCLILTDYHSNDYNIVSYYLNETGFFRNENIKVRFYCFNTSNNFFLCVDYFNISILYGFENNEGYQYLCSYNYRYDSVNLEIGYFLFELKIYNNSILYRYSEINYYTDNYIYAWINYSTQLLNLENIEVQIHARYGLNTLDIEILNYYVIIWFNYESYIEFYEQSRKDLNGCKLKSSFNYTASNFNFLNRTGIIGNYSYNCLKGCRSLYGNTDEIFHRYFSIPFFSQDIEVNIDFITPDDSYSNPDEPNLPSSYYWTYETYRVVYANTINIPVGNWTIEFKTMKAEIYTAKHPYEPQTLDKDDYPSFHFKFKFPEVLDDFSFTINLNFIRNFFVSVINLILLFIQWIGFYIISSLSYIFMFIGCSILVFLYNTLVYYIFIGLMYVLWYLFEGLYLLIAGLVWFYEYVILPFLRWCRDYLLPIIVEFAIYWISYFLAWMIYLITLGQVDRVEIQGIIYDLLWFLVIEIYNWIITFASNIYYILLFIVWYALCVLYLYLRYLLARSRGFKENAERYYYTLTFFLIPFKIVIDWIKELLGITPYV